jgi:hypothetical protein
LQTLHANTGVVIMGLWLNAWAGDNAGLPVGRKYFRALVALTVTEDDYPEVGASDLSDYFYYYGITVKNLTPKAMLAIVTDLDVVGGPLVVSLKITPVTSDGGDAEPWKPGVHLFAISMGTPTGMCASTIATVQVPPTMAEFEKEVIKLSNKASQKMKAIQKMLEMGRRPRFHDA